MKHDLIKKIVVSGILLAIAIVMQVFKNISPLITGPAVNTVIVLATLEVGIYVGIGFSVLLPCTSLLLAPATLTLATATKGLSVILIALGNIVFILMSILAYKLFKKYREKKIGYALFVIVLGVGAVLKWLFMWGSSEWIIKNIFTLEGKALQILTNVFSTTQLITAAISVPVIVAVKIALDKAYHRY